MQCMALMRNGHSRVFEYGYYFFTIAQEELSLHERESVADMAFAHRISKADKSDWDKFIKRSLPDQKKDPKKPKDQNKKQMTKEDHMRVIQRLKGIGR